MSAKIYKRLNVSRSIPYQDRLLLEKFPYIDGAPEYFDDEMAELVRESRRSSKDDIYTASVALVADSEEEANEAVRQFNAKGLVLHCAEEEQSWKTPIPRVPFIIAWKDARKRGAAKRGAEMSADKKKANSALAVAKIKDRWPLPSKEWPTKALLKEADISLNTAKAHLGKRPIAQYNYQAKLKRKANAKR
jgi:hypothetical protein